MTKDREDPFGRGAHKPGELHRRGWWATLKRVKDDISEKNLSLVAAGVGFYLFLSIFPGLAAFISLYGLVFEPAEAVAQAERLSTVLPSEASQLLLGQMRSLASSPEAALGLGAIISILVALYSAMKGMTALITALNIVNDEHESRGFIRLNLLAFGFTIGAVLLFAFALACIVALPPLSRYFTLIPGFDTLLLWARWPVMAVFVAAGLSVLYRFAPDREDPQWRWINIGSVTATLLWLLGSAAFTWYVASFGNFNETYGALGAVVVLMLWFQISAFVFLLGAELNAEAEHQTCEDSTTGSARPMGERGARMADTVAETRK